jgi:hypothetical protein
MILWVVIFLFLLFIGLLLWTPLRLVIDSTQDLYKVEWQYIGSAMLIENDDRLGVQIQILFYKKIIPFEVLFQKRVKPKVVKPPLKTPSVSKARFKPKIRELLTSFKIEKLKVNWDTDDYILNAYLYPITPFLRTPQKSLTINFEGKRDIQLIIENRLGRIIKSFFKSKIILK